jgi:phosphoglucosamine mutase
VGVLPTPGVAAVAAWLKSPAAMVSASHNPYTDNGVKLFAAGGRKLTDDEEAAVEAGLTGRAAPSPVAALGTIAADPGWRAWYCSRLLEALDGRTLGGLRVVLDCAHGAASATAAEVFRAAGADVVEVLSASPDGTNINAGNGSTDPSALQAAVVAHHAAAGLAFDGDADRAIAVDERGELVDGDRLMALFALDLQERGRLADHTVVVTVMTNLGFHRAMAAAGIAVHQTPVGDRYVLEALDGNGWSLGGEQSGHIVFRDLATTGDGVLSGLLLLDLLRRRGVRLAQAAEAAMERFPQVLRNVEVADRDHLPDASDVWAEVDAVSADLGDGGRILLRPSGTERLVRIMVEAPTTAEAEAAVSRIAAVVVEALGGA